MGRKFQGTKMPKNEKEESKKRFFGN